jgi:hypothetical protein
MVALVMPMSSYGDPVDNAVVHTVSPPTKPPESRRWGASPVNCPEILTDEAAAAATAAAG